MYVDQIRMRAARNPWRLTQEKRGLACIRLIGSGAAVRGLGTGHQADRGFELLRTIQER